MSAALDPAALLAISDLELRARAVMEGVTTGLHRSPFTGFSAEFTEYRQYSPGDDLRYLDWKAYARSDRFYLKKYEDETNLRCIIILDTSKSMDFGSTDYTKSDYARTFAATLACFMHTQRDVVGVALYDDTVHHMVPPRWRAGHMQHVYAGLAAAPRGRSTQTAQAAAEVRRICRKRTLLLWISDFLSPLDEWSGEFSLLSAAGHDVRAVQVLDPAEKSLDFGQAAIWRDVETDEERYVDPAQARADYQSKFNQHQQAVRDTLEHQGVPLFETSTDRPLDTVMRTFLNTSDRLRTRHRTGRKESV